MILNLSLILLSCVCLMQARDLEQARRQGLPVTCDGVMCGMPFCGNGVLPTLKPGDCCPSCPPTSLPYCIAYPCPPAYCVGAYVPLGKCCKRCPGADACVVDGVEYEIGRLSKNGDETPGYLRCISCTCQTGGKLHCGYDETKC